VSLLERAEECGLAAHLLDTQYRMSQQLCSLVSRLFYRGELRHADNYHPRFFNMEGVTDLCWYNVNGGEFQHHDRAHGGSQGFSNRREVRACFQLAMSLHEDYPEARIYILSFYRKQEEALLEYQDNHRHDLSGVVNHIGTIDSAQGDEADFVILTLAKSTGPTRFLLNPRRMCVALSRGRAATIIVGNRSRFSHEAMWIGINAMANRIAPFPELARFDADENDAEEYAHID
jgi:superfamily I DNA and/or RNA helicase